MPPTVMKSPVTPSSGLSGPLSPTAPGAGAALPAAEEAAGPEPARVVAVVLPAADWPAAAVVEPAALLAPLPVAADVAPPVAPVPPLVPPPALWPAPPVSVAAVSAGAAADWSPAPTPPSGEGAEAAPIWTTACFGWPGSAGCGP